MSIQQALQAGMQHHDAGRLAQAEASYHEVLKACPGHPDALALLCDITHRTGRLDEAIACAREAIRQRPALPVLHHKLATMLAERGDLEASESAWRAALRLKGDSADAWFHLGNVLALQGRAAEAIAAYRRAIAGHGGFAAAYNNLGMALEADARWEEALAAYRSALLLEDHPQVRSNVARCLAAMPRLPADAATRALVARALDEAWTRPADLARVGITMLRAQPAIRSAIDAVGAAWPQRAPAATVLAPDVLRACGEDRLFAALLENAPASDRELERFLTAARLALLDTAAAGGWPDAQREALVEFACTLARQCFFNDYVFGTTEAERATAARLREETARTLQAGALPDVACAATLACYFPLGSLPRAHAMLEAPWPQPLRGVLTQQVAEPEAERSLRAHIPALTAIAADVSRRVQSQYEESPYPRWTRLPSLPPLPLEAYLRSLFAPARLPPPGTIAERDILVAGCGTGQESVDLARQHPGSRILAVDLSLASLAYASRKTPEAGCTNVEYAQADLLELGSVGREFDLISCSGVLHHLADPLAGWRSLAAALRPGGFMQVGLYSAIARRDIAAARAMIAARGYTASPDDIRRCRDDMAADPRWSAVTSLRDFYGLNECRDLLFHVQEHCTTLPELRETLRQAGLEFVGLAVAPALMRAFMQRYPGASEADLDLWHAFETAFPQTFAGMYVFWVRKPSER